VQMDELYARVRDNPKARWLWVAIDPVTKAIPSIHLGGRKHEDTRASAAAWGVVSAVLSPRASARSVARTGAGLAREYRAHTPAMALGLTHRVLAVGDILRTPRLTAAA
jgi:hypothetical protein